MRHHLTLRRLVTSVALSAAFLCQVTWALAGTTGGLTGQVTDQHGAPVAGATVSVASPSESLSVVTDSSGHFAFLTLAPDTYTVTATKSGYNTHSVTGAVVFADQTLTLSISISSAPKEIAHVVSQAVGNLVRPGTTVDVYSVNATTAAQLATSGGGNNLDSAYSAIYSQPGVLGLPGNYGFGQIFFIHGSSYNQIGYEFDGVPVNRAFDNYNANSLSNLGAETTEIYTGGGPAGATSPTLGGYVNQIIKTGTFPGYGQLYGGIGTPAYYHQATVEAGGATPDRLFSWYLGIRGSDMIPQFYDAQNGADLNPNGDNQYGAQGFIWNTLIGLPYEFGFTSLRGPWSECTNGGSTAPTNGSYLSPVWAGLYGVTTGKLYACNVYSPLSATGATALRGNDLSDRENVVNFHVGVPHRHDAGRDDIQVLFDNFFYQTSGWDNLSTYGGVPYFGNMFADAGTPNGTGLYNTFLGSLLGAPPGYNILGPAGMPQYAGLCAFYNVLAFVGAGNRCPTTGYSPMPFYDGAQIVNAHFGQSALGSPDISAPYFFPSSPSNRAFGAGVSPYQVSDTDNLGSIVKLQYTKNFGSNAYVRVFGYTFYSAWLQTDPNYSYTPFGVGGATAGDYELSTHTRGLYLQLADQFDPQNLVQLTSSYTTASTLRANNAQWTLTAPGLPVASLISANGKCYAAYNNSQAGGLIDPGYPSSLKAGSPVSCVSALSGAPVAGVEAGTCAPGAAPFTCLQPAPAGTTWELTQNLEPFTNVNTVSPKFFDAALQDEFRPSDRWDITAGVRFESYGYGLGDYSSPEQAFWFNEINSTVCVDPVGLKQAPQSDLDAGAPRLPTVPGSYPSYITTAPGVACPFDPILGAQLYHPGQHGVPPITLGGSGTITLTTWSPRFGFTYAMSPDSVLRFSYGRYTQPTLTASEQVLTYLDGFQMANAVYNSAYYSNGFPSVVHNNPIQFSNNWDASFEQHLKNTDWTFKVSPFYRYTTNQAVEVSLPGGLAGDFNSGTLKAQGVELAVQKGDASRNGFSGQLSYTFTYTQLKYSLINGANIVSNLLNSLKPLESLEKVNGGSPCYYQGVGVPSCTKGIVVSGKTIPPSDFIYNPYYNFTYTEASLASQYPLTGFYPTYFNYFPYGLQLGDAATDNVPNIFSGFVTYKHNQFQATLTGNLWEGSQYGSPGDVSGIDPRSCIANQGQIGVVPGSQDGDYQTCSSNIAIPNPATGQLSSIGEFRNPWDLNLGAQLAYDVTPRIRVSALLANIGNWCFGGSAEPWTAAYPPNHFICTYAYNTSYLGWSPGEAYNTAGAGYFYGTSPRSSVNGTTGYPKVFEQPYAPSGFQIQAPFQVYFTASIRL
jgi:Carboxypeptidase regulatory-like domain/TonB dependent receptor